MNPATALATVLVDELFRCGVRDAVIAPGSRSAPLATALHDQPGLRLHVRIDERSAAFLALGLAKGSGRPVPVVCTSGTAAANLHPAVLEADQARVGLVVLTADRPPELRGTGANQTADQIKLYGAAVRFFAEVGVPETRPGMTAYWRSLVCRALVHAGDGPVHLNLPLREPLLADDEGAWPDTLAGRPDGAPWTAVSRSQPRAEPVDTPERGVVVVGDGATDPAAAVAFAEAVGWPVLAEPVSGARRGPHAVTGYGYLLGSPEVRARLRPEAVVTVGRPTLSRELLSLYSDDVPHTVVSPSQAWPDPTRTASRVIAALAGPERRRPAGPWLAAWQRADALVCAAVDGILAEHAELTELRLARDLAALLPAGGWLFAGSSTPIRNLDLLMRPRADITVSGNRGLSGIDGTVSTVIGTALTRQDTRLHDRSAPAYALIGDLTLLHDQNGLLAGAGEDRPDVTFVVVNNDGGVIFSMLDYRDLGSGFERLFGTPHGVSVGDVAKAAGWPFEAVTTAGELADLVAGHGPRIVEVRTERTATAALHDRVRRAVTAALAADAGELGRRH